MKDKKPRQFRIGADFGGPATITGMRQNDDGSITFFGVDGRPLPVRAAFAGLSYGRRKGPKVIYQLPDHGDAVGSLRVLANYSHIIGVDTNTLTYGSEKICVTVVAALEDFKLHGRRWSGTLVPLWALEFREPLKEPERIGWRHALATIENLGWLKEDQRTLLVVDAFLDDLHDINQRRKPLIDEFLLPRSVSIAYASSDSATESPINRLIAHCDSLARQILNYIKQPLSTGAGPLASAERSPFRSYRYWKFESEK